MDIEKLQADLEKVIEDKERLRNNMICDASFALGMEDSNNPWDRWESDKLRSYVNTDSEFYSKLFNRERRLRKIILRREKQYNWGGKRYRSEIVFSTRFNFAHDCQY